MGIGPIISLNSVGSASENIRSTLNLAHGANKMALNEDDQFELVIFQFFAKLGVFAYFFPMLQWCLLLMSFNLNLPPNFYNMLRIFTSFLYRGVADWQPFLQDKQFSYHQDMKFFTVQINDVSDFLPYRMRALNLSSLLLGNCEYILSMFVFLVLIRVLVVLVKSRVSANQMK